mmetsp:Transcript_27602/g.85544  ORF Transcript_27602/g.85544 Transcript_27602/m.85544 type:complete len:211 (+) Transcript_27602:1796-2428(+)
MLRHRRRLRRHRPCADDARGHGAVQRDVELVPRDGPVLLHRVHRGDDGQELPVLALERRPRPPVRDPVDRWCLPQLRHVRPRRDGLLGPHPVRPHRVRVVRRRRRPLPRERVPRVPRALAPARQVRDGELGHRLRVRHLRLRGHGVPPDARSRLLARGSVGGARLRRLGQLHDVLPHVGTARRPQVAARAAEVVAPELQQAAARGDARHA